MKVELTKQAQKDLRKIPDFIADRFYKWVLDITEQGTRNVRKVPGWHDEPLKGDRKGQRSIRLNRSY
ncbi:type II toxin-antitoxin system RelE family toxin [Pseudobacteriovorax antillogorgiicola]|uniref:Proteic killer suppression protein n=1 Tax=Pseudobacteriovorax antillogorgiicola TaxID=1513793 RepID=A0A1Y6BYW2_9BACT|nr:type II toxin-antitoxin system RelE/ParE family toxin [Pseudobacteriovorax antillogorgiicola]TCS52991.1 proteic killer suppression protein [Pseudobacteriovorax antillogorgiicola]SMF27270.1 proteic killer suppression protein [Pseudobacteriovorax antillogorgiicola]